MNPIQLNVFFRNELKPVYFEFPEEGCVKARFLDQELFEEFGFIEFIVADDRGCQGLQRGGVQLTQIYSAQEFDLMTL
jgi:hypothetical protein